MTKPMTDGRKLFILDTNVILHDSSCVDRFQEHDIVIPITVLEELDGFKKQEREVGYHARQFLRRIDDLSSGRVFDDGVSLGPGRGKLMIALEAELHDDLARTFERHKSDHLILNAAYVLAQQQPQRTVILISKDVNLRLKAKAVGLTAQDYEVDKVGDVDSLYTGRRVEENVSADLIDQLYHDGQEVAADAFGFDHPLTPNEYLILRNGKKSALARYTAETQMIRRVDRHEAFGIKPRNAEQAFSMDALLDPAIPLVTLTGKAGTGKTLLALACALDVKKRYEHILVARPIVPLSNKDSGFLPGEIDAKLAPYMRPLYDNMGVIKHQFGKSDSRYKMVRDLMDGDGLTITPLSYIRGRSLVREFFIVDEGQNLTPHEVKTVITRAGEGTKIVFTGDIFQIDHPYLDAESNGLSYLIERMRGHDMYAHVTLERGERSALAELASDLL